MVKASQQLMMTAQPPGTRINPCNHNTNPGDDFLKILDRTMGSEQTLRHNTRQGREPEGRKEFESNTTQQRVQKKRDTTGPDENSIKITQAGEEKPMRKVHTEPKSGARDDEMPGIGQDLPSEEGIHKESRGLPELLDEVMALFQKFFLLLTEFEPEALENDVPQSVMTEVTELKPLLEDNMAELIKAMEGMNGPDVSESLEELVKTFQELMEDDIFEQVIQNSKPVSARVITSLQNLLQKMLKETESIKNLMSRETTQMTIMPQMSGQLRETETGSVSNHDTEMTVDGAVNGEESYEGHETSGDEPEAYAQNQQDKGKPVPIIQRPSEQGRFELGREQAEPVFMDRYSESVNHEQVVSDPFRGVVNPRTAVVQQVVEKAETLLHENKSEMVMQLKPESLGKITLRVIHERGEIMAEFMADNDQVKAILESNMQLLKDSLEKSGIAVQNLSVSVGQHGQRQSEEKHQEQPKEKNPTIPISTGFERVNPNYRYGGFAGSINPEEGAGINLTA